MGGHLDLVIDVHNTQVELIYPQSIQKERIHKQIVLTS